jgi:hypothetical protein
MGYRVAALLVAVATVSAHATDPLLALPLADRLPRFPSERLQGEPSWPGVIASELTWIYGVAVHRETSATTPEGGTYTQAKMSGYTLAAEDTLSQAMDRIVMMWPGEVSWQRLGARSVLLRTIGPTAEPNILDTRIDVEIRLASIWEAAHAVCGAALRAAPGKRPFSLNLPGASRGRKPPDVLLQPGVVRDLKFADVPAREALCRVLEHAPFALQYTYLHHAYAQQPKAFIMLKAFARNEEESVHYHNTRESMSPSEIRHWNEASRVEP